MYKCYAIRTKGLSYQFNGETKTLDNIDLAVEAGSIYGFLGPNGAGKTTTLSLVLGLLDNQQGTIELFGEHLDANRINVLKRVGSLIESPSLYGHLTAKENLEIYRRIYQVPKERITESLQVAGLADTGKKRVKHFSLGMRQRLAIALALLPQPELLVLDEPANGLDPAGIIELRQMIKDLNEKHGMTILISSHLLSEIEKLVTYIGIINKGKLLFQGSLTDLKLLQQSGSRLIINTSDNERAMHILQELQPQLEGSTVSVMFQDLQHVASIQKTLAQNDLDVYMIQPRQNDLEQLFIELTTTTS